MRSLLILTTGVLILTASTALAEDYRTPGDPPGTQPAEVLRPFPEMTALQISPMHQEIKEVLLAAARSEEVLLKQLVEATDEMQCLRVIERIEQLDLRRDLDILHIQARYADKAERWDLAKQIRQRILELEAIQQEVSQVAVIN